MKVTIYFVIKRSCFKDPTSCDGLTEIFPIDPDANLFRGELDKNSPVLAAIFERLHAAGFKRWTDMSRQPLPNEYQINEDLKISRKDCLHAPYLNMIPNHTLDAVAQTNDAGQITLNLDPFDMSEVEPRTKRALFAGTLHMVCETDETLVSDSFRKIIEQEGLIGIHFEDRVKLTGELAAKVPEKYWVLRSNVLFPPYSKQTKWVDKQGQPCEAGAPGAEIPNGELPRYDASALAPLEPFDLGYWKGSKPSEQNQLMSQRFYKLCLKHKISLFPAYLVEVVSG